MSDVSLSQLQEKFLQAMAHVSGLEALQKIQSEYLGKKGALSQLYQTLPELPPPDRRSRGEQINTLRDFMTQKIQEAQAQWTQVDFLKKAHETALDLRLPLSEPKFRGRHPITQTMDYLIGVLTEMGFDVGEGNEVEHENYNFTYLNIPEHHPARASHDTFYVSPPYLLRTHTSPVQIHYMRQYSELPIQMIAPGRVYRADDDATHSPMFHQIEGLWVDVGVHFGHLKGVVSSFLQKVFESKRVRFRPSYFPFTEPSTEVDVGCVFCKEQATTSCRVCKGSRWLEVMGAGVVHPHVLTYGKCPPVVKGKAVSGFAFGLGVERLTMLLHRIPDMRLLFDNDPRVLNQVGRVRHLPLFSRF